MRTGLLNRAGDVRIAGEVNPATGQRETAPEKDGQQRQEVGATARGRGRVLAGAENDRSSQVYGVIWDVSTEGADARMASE